MRRAPHPASPSLPTRSVFPGNFKSPEVCEPHKLPIRARPPRPLFSRGHALSHGRYRDLCVASIARAARLDLCPAAFAPWGRTRDGGTSDKVYQTLEVRLTRRSSQRGASSHQYGIAIVPKNEQARRHPVTRRFGRSTCRASSPGSSAAALWGRSEAATTPDPAPRTPSAPRCPG